MRYPNFDGKHDQESMLKPEHFIEYMKSQSKTPDFKVPKGVILCYQRSLLTHIKKNHPTESCEGVISDLLYLKETNNEIAVIGGFGIGSPAASVMLEELIACGVKEFISIGTAGTLQKDIQIGDLILCDRAIRDEGTSHHYLPTEKYVHSSKNLTERLGNSLSKLGKPFKTGTTWTIDAPYRETIAEARHYQNEGVVTVDMEASALFAVAQYRGVEIAALFTVSDSLADLKWHPDFNNPKTLEGLETIYKAALQAF